MITGQQREWYVTQQHRLDMHRLMEAFQQFYRENPDIWSKETGYDEAAPQLIMQAFLQHIVDGGGTIRRVYGLDRKRTDLFIEWPLDEKQGNHDPLQRIVIELKILRDTLETTTNKGLEQTAEYAESVGADEAHLVIFDRGSKRTWKQKIWRREEKQGDYPVTVWGA
jgi:hypothetical protein